MNESHETLVLRDEQDQLLKCEILRQVVIEDQTYALVTPVDAVIKVLVWEGEEEPGQPVNGDADMEGILDEPDPEELQAAMPTIQAVLGELNLTLQQNGFDILTVQGELPAVEDEDVLEIGESDEDAQEFQLLATFFYKDQKYGIFTPLDPILIYAALPDEGDPYLLTPDDPPELFDQLYALLLDLDEEEVDDEDED
ncbi:DUF3727 domain-containing protein [Thermostichus vulcanus]|uniref:DUF3727 domain-containing protein n=1 Tax=Thermostichus vulcanus str. 'Rupite' TaxID=2813851 RepID=A0ABT0CCI5_THEVL|nr:DUF3727 domain-containing protein [Thermostichus vulcanus]MCJ2543434.1 DUF3727 domain-containing protein [Thermostichus vulcanus str. 'Rupite']